MESRARRNEVEEVGEKVRAERDREEERERDGRRKGGQTLRE